MALAGVRAHHPFDRVGLANLITGVRAVITALIAGAIAQAPTRALTWTLVVIAILAAVLDGFDGWAARRHGMSSAFGARFDMEVDAVLILVLAALAWRFDKAGPWVLASGLMRYGFVAAAWVWPWLDAPLPPSRRRQTVCVVQIGVLIGTIAPIIRPPLSVLVAAGALAMLTWSFAVDVRWLMRTRQTVSLCYHRGLQMSLPATVISREAHWCRHSISSSDGRPLPPRSSCSISR